MARGVCCKVLNHLVQDAEWGIDVNGCVALASWDVEEVNVGTVLVMIPGAQL